MSAARLAPWVICPCCHGNGTMDTQGVIDPRDWEDDDFDQYLAGAYDRTCSVCHGSGKTREDDEEANGPVIVRYTPGGSPVIYRDPDDAAEHSLRMAGG